MAEAIAITLSTKLGLLLSRNAALGISQLFGVSSDIVAAKRELDLLRSFLRFADSHHPRNDDRVAELVKQVRDTAFELEDIADECSYLSGHGLARDCINIKAWFSLSKRLRRTRGRLHQLSEVTDHFGIALPECPATSLTSNSGSLAERAHFLEEEEVIGFSAHQEQLMEWLVRDAEPQRTLVAVCGMGGVGKTTLVSRVYRQVATAHFECAAWVSVSQGFPLDVNNLLRMILKELQRNNRGSTVSSDNDAGADYSSLVSALHDHLTKRRYIVVLDDVWDPDLWSKIRHVFLDDANCSRAVITTRKADVAKAAKQGRIMNVEPLPYTAAWELFCFHAFREVSGRTCPDHLKEHAANILRRCCGLPLAVVAVGNLLARKERTEFAWRNALDNLDWDTTTSDLEIGEAASILNLSIDDLPYNLKKCFFSCSLYPEDFLIKRKILIRRWVAQGIVVSKNPGQREEDVADAYLEQLVQRNLMQAVVRNESGRAKRCLIHDLIRQLIINRSREEEGHMYFLKCNITANSMVRIRHIAVDRCEVVNTQDVPQHSTKLRSFSAYGSELQARSLSCFRLLTVLSIWFVKISKLPDAVTNLHNLRYLGIRSTLVEELPSRLGNLQKLQTFDAKLSMVRRLPRSITKLKSLRHLIVLTRETSDLLKPYPGMAVGLLPQGIENLTSLQTLKYVKADNMMVRSLASLEQMRSLDLTGIYGNLIQDLSSSISKMSCLQRLGLAVASDEDAVLDLESIYRPPTELQSLALTGKLARGQLPGWTPSLTSIIHVRLSGCQIGHESLLLLGKLPRLRNLAIIDAYCGCNIVFVEGSFMSLQKLTLENLPHLSHIEFQRGCMFYIRYLVIGLCTVLTEIPRGMETFKHLQNLELFGMPTEFVDKLKQKNGNARYYNPASSDFYQAHRFLRCIRFVERSR